MADVAAAFIAGHQAGDAHRQHEQALEESKLQQTILKHQLDALKIQDKVRARDMAIQNGQLTSGQPRASYAPADFATEMVNSMGQSAGQPDLLPTQVPGIPEMGVSGISLPRQTLEQVIAAHEAGKLRELAMKPLKVNEAERVILPGTGQVIAEGAARTPPPVQLQQKMVRLKGVGDVPVNFNPVTGQSFYNGQDVSGKITDIPNATGQGSTLEALSPEAVQDTAMRYHIFGTGAIPSRIGESDRIRILNENAKINSALGQSPAVAIQRQLAVKADGASLNRATILADASRAAAAKAEPQADLIVTLSNKVGRTGIPALNKALLAGKREIAGDTDATLLLGALTEFTAEYAKIIEGSANSSAGASVESRRKAEQLVTSAMSKGTLDAQIKQMKQIMDWTIQGYDATIAGISDRIGGGTTGAPGAPSPARSSGQREIVYDLNGKPIQ